MSPQTSLLGVNLLNPRDVRSQAAGIKMTTTTSATMLNVLPAELICAMRLVGREAMTLWMIMMKTVSRKVW